MSWIKLKKYMQSQPSGSGNSQDPGGDRASNERSVRRRSELFKLEEDVQPRRFPAAACDTELPRVPQ